MGLPERIAARMGGKRSIATIDDYASMLNSFDFLGNTYPLAGVNVQQTLAGNRAELIPNSFEAYASRLYASNGIVFACMGVRMLVFSAARFIFQQLNKGRPSEMFGNPSLALLERPWPGATTQDLLKQMLLDADLAGNSYWTVAPDGYVTWLRPDWVEIILAERIVRGAPMGWERVGYRYTEGGPYSGKPSVGFTVDEVAHFAPYPDPCASYRGMSWLTPVVREVENDKLMNVHKRKFFENGATPNMVVKGITATNRDEFDKIVEMLEANHTGTANAYKTLYLTAGADATVVGADLKSLDFKAVQGAGETRIAAAAGVPPVIVGLSEGLSGSSLNAGNYGQARRRFADGTLHPLWMDAVGSMQQILAPPNAGTRLWYDTRDVPFLREDRDAAAKIQQEQASTMRSLIDAAFIPESVVAAVDAEDWSLLKHSGIPTVQVQNIVPPDTNSGGANNTGNSGGTGNGS